MTEQESLDDILENRESKIAETTDEVVEETPAEQSDEPEAATDGPARDERGRFAPKGEKQPETDLGEPPSPQEEPTGNVPLTALKDERSKRQALESELAQLRAQFAQQQVQNEPQFQAPQGPPDRWEDPEGYDRWLVMTATEAAKQQAIEAMEYQRIVASASQVRAEKPDYDEVIQVFAQMARQNPGLEAQMKQSAQPAVYAYDTAKEAIEINRAGGLRAYIAQEAAKLAEQQNLAGVADKLPQSLPPSISSDRSVGSRSGPQWSGPPSLDDLLR